MKERGATVHLKRTHGRGTGNDILLGSTQWNSPVDTSPTMIHGSMLTDGAK